MFILEGVLCVFSYIAMLADAPVKLVTQSPAPHETKGGWCITEYITYDWYITMIYSRLHLIGTPWELPFIRSCKYQNALVRQYMIL